MTFEFDLTSDDITAIKTMVGALPESKRKDMEIIAGGETHPYTSMSDLEKLQKRYHSIEIRYSPR